MHPIFSEALIIFQIWMENAARHKTAQKEKRETNWKSKPQELLLWYLRKKEMKMISIMNKCWKGEGFPFTWLQSP